MWSEVGWRAFVGGLWLEGGHVVPFFLAAPVRFRVDVLRRADVADQEGRLLYLSRYLDE